TSVEGLAATAPPTRTRPARTAAPAASRLGARPRRTSSPSSRTRVATGALQRLETPELGEDGRVDRLEDVRMLGRVTLVQPGQGGLDLARRVGDTLVLRQRPIRPAHDTSRARNNTASIGGPGRSPAAHGCGQPSVPGSAVGYPPRRGPNSGGRRRGPPPPGPPRGGAAA